MNLYPWFKPARLNPKLGKELPLSLLKSKTMGKYSYQLEKKIKKILKVKHVVLTNSGTSALMMASIALGINNKKKVICTNMTWIATINPSLILGAKIYLVDTVKNSQSVDFEKMNKMIKRIKPDVVILVHLSGENLNNKEFNKLKKRYGFMVIEDAAQSFLNKSLNNNYCGTGYEIGCFSLSITKIVNMVYGGFCCTNSNYLANKLKAIRNNGVNASPEMAREELAETYGLNFKPSDLHSYFGLQNLKNRNRIKKTVNQIYNLYKKKIKTNKIKLIKINHNFLPTVYCSAIIDNRKKFSSFCDKNNIEIHYGLRCLSESKLLKNNKIKAPNSKRLSSNLIRLPSGPGYKLEEIDKIIKILNKYK